MENQEVRKITVTTTIRASLEEVWECWTTPTSIMQWNHASEDWHTTRAENDLRPGGLFLSRMEAKDGSFGFDFSGTYDTVICNELIEYTLGDNRQVKITFQKLSDSTVLTETFDAEEVNTVERQQFGWQCILDNFRKFVESGSLKD